MKNLFLICILVSSLTLFGQDKFTLSGIISEKSSNETLIGVNILFPEINRGVVSNEYGFYSITLPEGTYKVQISYLGFKDIILAVDLNQDIKQNFQLSEGSEMLEEIVITEDVERMDVRDPQMSVNKLSAETIKQIPVVLGEADVIKSILLLPGVTNAGEGSSGFNVRGGATDQNLILLDEATIFNSSHLFGFFSIFNPDAIKDLKLYKGGIPARYGGRISSVLDIYQREGNSKKFKANGGIGLVASRLLVEGPIVKDKSAFLFGGRGTYAHLFFPLFDLDNTAYFYDLNTKLNYRINENNNIFLSGYFGRDVLGFSELFKNTYGNAVLNLRWNHLFSDQLFSNLSVIYSDYYYGLDLNFIGFEWNSGIRNFNLKYDLTHYLSDKFQLRYGINNIYYDFNPGEIAPNSNNSGIVADKLIRKYANELGVYLDAEHEITSKLKLQYGIRFSNFVRLGQDELNIYENENPLLYNAQTQIYSSAEPVSTQSFKRSESIKTFNNFEPRFAASYLINDNSSLKVSYNRMAQYLHLLSNTNAPTPLDVWTPSGKFIKAQLLNQYAFGYFKNINNAKYTFETEVFYKDIANRIDYINGADLIANDAIERVILNGEARAYGAEFLFRKNKGDFTGWLAYTLSRSEQRTPGRTENEIGINNGEWFKTPFDKTHDISFTGSYKINNQIKINTNLVFQTGQPTNYPIGKYVYEGVVTPLYDGDTRNNERLPEYHRLDLSLTLTPKNNATRKWKGEWIFSIYNVYNRKNALSFAFSQNMDTGRNEAVRTAIFGIVPAVTYNFKF